MGERGQTGEASQGAAVEPSQSPWTERRSQAMGTAGFQRTLSYSTFRHVRNETDAERWIESNKAKKKEEKINTGGFAGDFVTQNAAGM